MTQEEKNYKDRLEDIIKKMRNLMYGSDLIKGTLKNDIERIFPELVESEDEKIRKGIITYLKNMKNSPYVSYSDDTTICDKMIDWLERQSDESRIEAIAEQKQVINNTEWYICTDDIEHFLKDCIYDTDSDGDLRSYDGYVIDLDIPFVRKHFRPLTFEDIKNMNHKVVEWSDEDEKGLDDALWCCKQAASISKDENDMGNCWYAEHWLKSLKNKIFQQR